MTKQEAQSLLTKFFYIGNHLHFQILVQTESDMFIYGEYNDYGVYKKAFDILQTNLKNEIKIMNVSEKNVALECVFANVAWFSVEYEI